MDFIIADDSGFNAVSADITPAGTFSKGYIPRDYERQPFGSLPYAAAFDLPLVPRTEWSARIVEMEEQKSRLSDVRRGAGLVSQDQDGIPYCWIHAVISAMRLDRAKANLPNVALSATSAGARIKNFRSEGGWSTEGLEHVIKYGVSSVEFWPENKIDPRYDTSESRANAMLHQATEWRDMQPRNFDQLMTCLFLRIPVAVGYNHWQHAIVAMDPVERAGVFGVRIWNSWADSWGDMGEGLLLGSKAIADDQCALLVSDASTK